MAQFEAWVRDDVLKELLREDGQTSADIYPTIECTPRLLRVQAGSMQGERLALECTDGRHEVCVVPSTACLKLFKRDNPDFSAESFFGDRRVAEGSEQGPMVGEVIRIDNYRLLVESGPAPVYGVRAMSYMEGMADELGDDEEEEEEEEEPEEGEERKPKAEKAPDPLMTAEEVEQALTIKRRRVRGTAADGAATAEWTEPATKQTNPPPTAKATDHKAAVLLAKGQCHHRQYAAVNIGPKVMLFFDTSDKAATNERIVNCFDTEEGHFTRHVIDDCRLTKESPAFSGGSDPVAVAGEGKVYVFGGLPADKNVPQLLQLDPLTMETHLLDYSADVQFPACDFSKAVVGMFGAELWVISGELGWDKAYVLDTGQIGGAAAEVAPAAEDVVHDEEAAPAEVACAEEVAADEEASPASPAEAAPSSLCGCWTVVTLEASAESAPVAGKLEEYAAVWLDDEMWVFQSTPEGITVRLLSSGRRLQQAVARGQIAAQDMDEADSETCAEQIWEQVQLTHKRQGKCYWIQPPVDGSAPPPMSHFQARLIGRSVWLFGGRLFEHPTAAFKGAGCEFDSGYDYGYVLDTDRCEWSVRHMHGAIPHSPAKASAVAYGADLWLFYPCVSADTWWWAGAPQMPADYKSDKTVRSTKFGGIQSTYCLSRAMHPPQSQAPPPNEVTLDATRTWVKPEQPIDWKALPPREYLDRAVWPQVLKALNWVETTRPGNPCKALAMHLLASHQDTVIETKVGGKWERSVGNLTL